MAIIEEIRTEVLAHRTLLNVIVRVRDSDGMVGTGEAWWGIPDRSNPAAATTPIVAVIDHLLTQRLVGRDADAIEHLWFELWDWGYRYADQGVFMMGLSGVDLALWDLKGKRLGVGVAELLGGPIADAIPGYASLPPLNRQALVEVQTQRALDAGLRAVKLHERDPVVATQALRRQFGDDLIIMVDVNGHFDPIEAIDVGRQLYELGVLWFEEPVRPMRDHAAIARVAQATHCAIAAGENEYSLLEFERLLATNAISYLQPEITKIGGMSAARRVSTLTELHNVALCPHNFRLGPSLYASIQWAFTTPSARWIELPWLPENMQFSFATDLPELEDGQVLPIAAPGLGCVEYLE